MKDVKIVIGANYGDEGKGQMTDYFCHKARKDGKSCCVVLSNGGAQRGHTVVTPDGRRHVFKHIGSGDFAFANTYMPEHFIVNPLEFSKESIDLYNLHGMNWVTVHPNCMVTTPWDMIANMIIEDSRGENRHGSCGMGIWETIQRNMFYPLTWSDCVELPERYLIDIFPQMVQEYYEERFGRLGISNIGEWQYIFYGQALSELFVRKTYEMIAQVKTDTYETLNKYDCLVFENAQGLLLDQNRNPVEYTTPSNTGLKNPMEILSEVDWTDSNELNIEACYVSRVYLTRHGNGIFNEVRACDISKLIVDDETNKYNDYQGRLRYGYLDEESLEERILEDVEPYLQMVKTVSLALTHTNECEMPKRKFNVDKMYYSDGKTRNEVYE